MPRVCGEGVHGKRGSQTYNRGLRVESPAGSRSRAPWRRTPCCIVTIWGVGQFVTKSFLQNKKISLTFGDPGPLPHPRSDDVYRSFVFYCFVIVFILSHFGFLFCDNVNVIANRKWTQHIVICNWCRSQKCNSGKIICRQKQEQNTFHEDWKRVRYCYSESSSDFETCLPSRYFYAILRRRMNNSTTAQQIPLRGRFDVFSTTSGTMLPSCHARCL